MSTEIYNVYEIIMYSIQVGFVIGIFASLLLKVAWWRI